MLLHHINQTKHFYTIPQDEDDLFPKDLVNKIILENSDSIQISIYHTLAILVSVYNISANQASDKIMISFCKYLINIGIEIRKQKQNLIRCK